MRVKIKKRSIRALVNEGLLDSLINEFEKYQEQEAAAWLRATQKSDAKSKLLPSGFKKDGSPTTKLQAASAATIALGTAVKEADEGRAPVESALKQVSSLAEESENFVKASAELYKVITEKLAPVTGWLKHPDLQDASKDISEIGNDLESETIAGSMEKIGEAFKKIGETGLADEVNRMFNDEVAKKTLEKDAKENGTLSELVDEAKIMLPYLEKADIIADFFNSLPEKLKKIDEVIQAKADQPEDQEELKTSMFESSIRKIVRKELKKARI